jgi:hypothetical protein
VLKGCTESTLIERASFRIRALGLKKPGEVVEGKSRIRMLVV